MFEEPNKKKRFAPQAVVEWMAVLLIKQRPASVFMNAKSEYNLADTLAHETAVLNAARGLVPQTEDLAPAHAFLKSKIALISAEPRHRGASEKATLAYKGWTNEMVAALNHPDNPLLSGRRSGGIAANILTTLAGPIGRDFIDFLVHATLRPTLEGADSEHAVLPILTVPLLLNQVFESPFGAGSRQPISQLIEIMGYLGFSKIVRGYDAYLAEYLADVENGNPVSLFAAGFTPEQLEEQNRQPVVSNGETKHRRVNATTEMIVLTADFFIFVAERDELAAKWNANKLKSLYGAMKRFLVRVAAWRKILGRPTVLAAVAAASLAAGESSAQPTGGNWMVPHVTQHEESVVYANAGSKFIGSDRDILVSFETNADQRNYAQSTGMTDVIWTGNTEGSVSVSREDALSGSAEKPRFDSKPVEDNILDANAGRKFVGSGGDILASFDNADGRDRLLGGQEVTALLKEARDLDATNDLSRGFVDASAKGFALTDEATEAGGVTYMFTVAAVDALTTPGATYPWMPNSVWENAGSKRVGSDKEILR